MKYLSYITFLKRWYFCKTFHADVSNSVKKIINAQTPISLIILRRKPRRYRKIAHIVTASLQQFSPRHNFTQFTNITNLIVKCLDHFI